MENNKVFIAKIPLSIKKRNIEGAFCTIKGERYYKITNYDRMSPFLMSLVSNADFWMFISSNGSLTAGRKNPDNALFPYCTDDKINDYQDITGSKTIIRVSTEKGLLLWEPFSAKYPYVYSIQRNLYKNRLGNKLIFEEINEDLSLTFQYGWYNSEGFGFVKNAKLTNNGQKLVSVHVLDGIRNILPYGVNSAMQNEYSTLLDAYKKNELVSETGLGIFRLSSIPVDKAEPSEALKATIVWSEGLQNSKKLISSLQLDKFRQGLAVEEEIDIKATRGAYFVNAQFKLHAGGERDWNIIAELEKDAADIIYRNKTITETRNLKEVIFENIRHGSENLEKIIASADGNQLTADELSTSRHFANVLFNVMRGGIFEQNYQVRKNDLYSFLVNANQPIIENQTGFLNSLKDKLNYSELLKLAGQSENPDIIRLCYEYLPLTFSRRHGDPSRPWNWFSIDGRNHDGTRKLGFQGNWRDIFQNWEALSLSYPEYLESMVCKFVNASTFDGYNPYRITRKGIDWEELDPADPWSNIGYWGDHQIIYLLKLLKNTKNHHPEKLLRFLIKDIFSYANVPYKIKPYEDLLKNPHNTIEFDEKLNDIIKQRVNQIGSDGKLVWTKLKKVHHVNLTEKLLVTSLAKLTNFIPGGGIWMNTQRPEWNDANNALVGFGISMVTVYYLRKFQVFCLDLFKSLDVPDVKIADEVAELLDRINAVFQNYKYILDEEISDKNRKSVLDELGKAGSEYRGKIYTSGFTGKRKAVKIIDLIEFLEISIKYIDATIKSNKRNDNLYHAYNLMSYESKSKIKIRSLHEMLEGQVAVISSGLLPAGEIVEVLDALKQSTLFRQDQFSYILYPDRRLPSFLEKNNIPQAEFSKSDLLKKLVENNNRDVVLKNVDGGYHFNGIFRNATFLKEALSNLPGEYQDLVQKEHQLVLDIYEKVFDHQSFTGRSGTFYGYEGLGCIYWHMVSKLLLAVNESYYIAVKNNVDVHTLSRLVEHYYEIRAGIGLNKSPELYGAFPTDPYSHTPGNAGAQQPGMTGQVKEDIICRFGELGVVIENGSISFKPVLIRKLEFLAKSGKFSFYDVNGISREILLEKNSLAFTYCQIPVKYKLSEYNKIIITKSNGSLIEISGDTIDKVTSQAIFNRTSEIVKIEVWLMPGL